MAQSSSMAPAARQSSLMGQSSSMAPGARQSSSLEKALMHGVSHACLTEAEYTIAYFNISSFNQLSRY